jgi:hypothetical protein
MAFERQPKEIGMNITELETKAQPIISKLDEGVMVNALSEEERRLALAYKMWADGQDFGSDLFNVLDPEQVQSNQVLILLCKVFGYKGILPGIGA